MIVRTISSGRYLDKKKKGDGSKQRKRTNTRPPLKLEGEKLGIVIIGAQHAREVRIH